MHRFHATCGRDETSFESFAPITCAAPRRRRHAGFTLIETMAALSAVGILSSVAYPALTGQLQKARRSDAVVSAVQVQLAQERHRSNHAGYGTLADLAIAPRTPGGHYTLAVSDAGSDGYTLVATAAGGQARDAACRVMTLVVDGTLTTHRSGPDAQVHNDATANRRCWGL